MKLPPVIAVVGAGHADQKTAELAEAVGREIALAGAWLICGGLGGVMEAASRGAHAGGMTIGILPGIDRTMANPYIALAIATGLGEGRNLVIIHNADAIIAVGGEWGTLSEIAFARKVGKPVIGLLTWDLRKPSGTPADIHVAQSPREAVELALEVIRRRRR
ncbi:MAG: TIGR00725 family protein [Ardenticatenia bacterium]|nr:TIGR00725 family protein [Ardenticatenia bacterium]